MPERLQKRSPSDSAATPQQLQSAPIAGLLRSDCAIAQQFRRQSIPQRLSSDAAAIAKRSPSDSAGIV
jgi:hypothetical protein